MRIKWHWGGKDGGPDSKVYMYGFEWKEAFSLLLLRFEEGSREAYHSHAFNCVSLVLSGGLEEAVANERTTWFHFPSDVIHTYRTTLHKVYSHGRSWVLTLRGPWASTWVDRLPGQPPIQLTHGRRLVGVVSE